MKVYTNFEILPRKRILEYIPNSPWHTKKETYFGYKVHTLVTLEGYSFAFEITPASTDDQEDLQDIIANQSRLVIFGDKGYVGDKLTQDMTQQRICLMTLKRSNSKNNLTKLMY